MLFDGIYKLTAKSTVTMKLKDAELKSAKCIDKPLKLRDGNGLYLHVKPSGRY